MYKAPKEKPKTKARQYIESKQKYNIATKEDYLRIGDVAIAINMNALEQRMLAKMQVLKSLEREISINKLIEMLEKEIDLDRHRLVKYYKLMED